MIQISKSERAMIYRVYPTERIPKTKNRNYYMPEEARLLKVIKDANQEAKQVLKERYGWSAEA